MALSKEVQAQADEIRRNKSLVKSLQAERDLWKSKAMDSQSKLDELASKDELSDEDREELRRQAAELDALNDELEGAAQENTKPEKSPESSAPSSGSSNNPDAIPPVGAEGHPTEPLTSGDVLAANGPANHPAGGSVPMMPNMAFDPDPVGIAAGGNAGQPDQPVAIETAGGFVVQGGGTTQRAPGSSPESPSSSQVVPLDPDAKAPASTADLVKSGLGDSSQNALLGNDGQPISFGPGMPRPVTEADQKAAQDQADKVAAEQEARRANPLNLAPEGTPQAGSPEAEKASRDAALEAQRNATDAIRAEKERNDMEQGKPAASSDFPDESKPAPSLPIEDRPNITQNPS